MDIQIENEFVRYVITSDGTNLHFVDKRSDRDHCVRDPVSHFACVKKGGGDFDATMATYAGGKITVSFGRAEVRAEIGVTAEKHYLVLKVLSIEGEGVEEMAFVQLPLEFEGTVKETFAACALALNLKTNVSELPGPNSHLRAICYPKFGFVGAKVALIGCPYDQLRKVMQEVVVGSGDLPRSALGGPWALDSDKNRGSYLFNFGDLTEEKADDWIRLARSMGINQIDFHGGRSFRFGDCRPNPDTYPDGLASIKAVTDKLHAAGILAGLHTYSFFIDKSCPWVTPVPDPRLAKDVTFSLAKPLKAEGSRIPVVESAENMSTVTGFFVRNSVTLQIDDELITYSGISKKPPYAFTGCERGAYGTMASPHRSGVKVHHLKECFGLFVPDGDSTLYDEVAASTAEAFNEGGFDMMYLDALDGEDVVGGRENGWHYGSKFVFKIWKRLKRPAMMEMSTFHHHLWFVRSRMGAWDHPSRSHKKFIDIHNLANENCRRMFLPGHLGWWSFKSFSGPQVEPTFADDIEYLCCKCLATDTGLSIMGINPDNISGIPALPRLAAVMKHYEDLRNANYFGDSVKERLKVPGDEFKLVKSLSGEWTFREMQYVKHRVEGINGWSNNWQVQNKFGRQPVQLRIEALMSAGPYSAPGNLTLADFSDGRDFPERACADGVGVDLQPSSVQVKEGEVSGCFTASNDLESRQGTWAKAGKVFSPPLNMSEHQAIGVWVHGDGQGEVLNFQMRSPEHVSTAIGEHYVPVDFKGWRYFELVEPEGERYSDYVWPYGGAYSIYRESIDYEKVESLALWYNNLPPKKTVTCYIGPIRAMPLVNAKLRNPTVTIEGKAIVFPTEMESGCYLEFNSISDCKLYGPKGELIDEVIPVGEVPALKEGENKVSFNCKGPEEAGARARVTVISEGGLLK